MKQKVDCVHMRECTRNKRNEIHKNNLPYEKANNLPDENSAQEQETHNVVVDENVAGRIPGSGKVGFEHLG